MKTKIWMLLALALFLTGCNDSEDVVVATPETELITKADETRLLISTGRLLRSTSERDRLQTIGAIDRIKTGVALLQKNPNDRSALISLKTAYKFLDKIFITERDQPRLDEVFAPGRSLMVKYANIQGVNLDDLKWSIFSYRFSNTVSPFGSTDVPIKWEIQFVQQERYAIRTRGRNTRAVLLTPTFDLSNVTGAAYSLRHSFRVEAAFPPQPVFNRSEIISKAFRAYVSTEYKDGDEFDFKKWQRVDLGSLPQGLNFNTVDSGLIDLSRYTGKKITIAFVYDNNQSIFNHSLNWAIERFELFGVTENLKVTNRPKPFDPAAQNSLGKKVWHHDFNRVQLGKLEQTTLEGNAAKFIDTERNGTKYIKTEGREANGTQLLYSAPIDLTDVANPAIRIQHTINFYTEEFQKTKDVKLVVAIDEEGTDVKDLQWQTVDFEKNNPPGTNWGLYTSEFVSLPKEMAGRKIRVGWSHTSRAEQGSTPAWQIHDTWIRDIEEDLL